MPGDDDGYGEGPFGGPPGDRKDDEREEEGGFEFVGDARPGSMADVNVETLNHLYEMAEANDWPHIKEYVRGQFQVRTLRRSARDHGLERRGPE